MENEKTKNDEVIVKKRGRPSTGKALSPAERKQHQKDRDWLNANVNDDFSKLTSAGLMEVLQSYMRSGYVNLLDKAVKELYTRARANEAIRETKLNTIKS